MPKINAATRQRPPNTVLTIVPISAGRDRVSVVAPSVEDPVVPVEVLAGQNQSRVLLTQFIGFLPATSPEPAVAVAASAKTVMTAAVWPQAHEVILLLSVRAVARMYVTHVADAPVLIRSAISSFCTKRVGMHLP